MGGLGAGLNQNIDWNNMKDLSKFEKNFYVEHPDITKRSQKDVDAFYKKHEIVLQGKDIPKPVMTFEESPFPEYVLKTIYDCGFTAPTPIQSQGWPMALSGRDVVRSHLYPTSSIKYFFSNISHSNTGGHSCHGIWKNTLVHFACNCPHQRTRVSSSG